jgi:1,4-dihydroxy-2-naphthoate polyprenyltransferase
MSVLKIINQMFPLVNKDEKMHHAIMTQRIRQYLLAPRPWSFSMTVISVLLAAACASFQVTFQPLYLLLLLPSMILIHAGSNLINDYFDFRHDVDKKDAPTTKYRKHPILEGIFDAPAVLRYAIILLSASVILGIILIILTGWVIIPFAVFGGLASLFYTGDPVKYKHKALGEIFVFLLWGPVMMCASYFILAGTWQGFAVVFTASIPQGLWVALVLLANNMTDIKYDGSVGVKTLATVLKRKGAFRLYVALTALIYIAIIIEVSTQLLPVWTLLTLGSLPLALQLGMKFSGSAEIPADADPRTARIGMIFGILFITAFIIERLSGS